MGKLVNLQAQEMERSLTQSEHEARFRPTIKKSPSLQTVKNVPSAVLWRR